MANHCGFVEPRAIPGGIGGLRLAYNAAVGATGARFRAYEVDEAGMLWVKHGETGVGQ